MNKKLFFSVILLSSAVLSFAGGGDAESVIDFMLVEEAKTLMEGYKTTHGFKNPGTLYLEVGYVAEHLKNKSASLQVAEAYIRTLFTNVDCVSNRDMVHTILQSVGFKVPVKIKTKR